MYHTEFQFLIGTLKTRTPDMLPIASSEFQFLIGTLKTILCDLPYGMTAWFQFLIGTLKTKIIRKYGNLKGNVSIPHRYAKNPPGFTVEQEAC